MASRPTLHSKLRVLVAKSFRAEKLYSSIRNTHNLKDVNALEVRFRDREVAGETSSCPAGLATVANDIRAREWQRSYYELRQALNDLLSDGNKKSQIAAELQALHASFKQRAEQSAVAIAEGSDLLGQASKRQEFAHVFRLSAELIRHKACVQVSRVICEELLSVLDNSGAANKPIVNDIPVGKSVATEVLESQASNVVPLRRKFVANGRNR